MALGGFAVLVLGVAKMWSPGDGDYTEGATGEVQPSAGAVFRIGPTDPFFTMKPGRMARIRLWVGLA
jgi:hypothetical protein